MRRNCFKPPTRWNDGSTVSPLSSANRNFPTTLTKCLTLNIGLRNFKDIPYCFSLLGQNILHSTLFLNTLNLRSLRTTNEICTSSLVFRLLDTRLKEKGSDLKRRKRSGLNLSAYMEFQNILFVSRVCL